MSVLEIICCLLGMAETTYCQLEEGVIGLKWFTLRCKAKDLKKKLDEEESSLKAARLIAASGLVR